MKKKKRVPPRKQTSTIPSGSKWDRKFWVGIAVGIVSIILGALVLKQRLTITLESPTDPSNIMSTQIIISNDGILALEDVDVAIFIRNIQGPKYGASRISGTRYQPPARQMNVGDKRTVRLAPWRVGVGQPIQNVDIGVMVCYRPEILPKWLWAGNPKVFRIDSVLQSNGEVRLRQQPDDGNILAEYEMAIGSKACRSTE